MESKYSTFILFSAETQLQEKHSFIADHIPGPDWLWGAPGVFQLVWTADRPAVSGPCWKCENEIGKSTQGSYSSSTVDCEPPCLL